MKALHFRFSHKNPSDGFSIKKLRAFILSVLLHGIVLFIFVILEFEYISQDKDDYFTITLKEINPSESIQKNEIGLKKEKEPHQKEERSIENNSRVNEITIKVEKDTSVMKQEIFIPGTELEVNNEENLKFAESLLDSFLILYPEYSRYILKEQAKNIKGNPNDKRFSRLALEKMINDELHKYISEKFPEGSQHEINKYTGPGLNIPIGDLIDIIRKIFQ